jgi:hypothetical protein
MARPILDVMKAFSLRSIVRVGAVLLPGVATPAEAQSGGVDAVRWMAACWEMSSGTRRVVERWTEPTNGELRGSSRTIVGTREVEGERLRIYAAGDSLVYDARPSGQARTEFRGRATGAGEVLFENRGHDFPQRISYRRVGSDSLVARIEGDRDNRRQPVTYAYRRVDCAAFSPTPAEVAEDALQRRYAELVTMLDASTMGLNSWFAKHGRPDFNYVYWATAGYRPPVVTREQVDRAAQQQANPAAASMTERAHRITIERTLLRGDTAEALVTLTMSHKFVDTQGRYGSAGETRPRTIEHQRLDRWIRNGDGWQLASAALLSDEIRVDGKLVVRNGRPVP